MKKFLALTFSLLILSACEPSTPVATTPATPTPSNTISQSTAPQGIELTGTSTTPIDSTKPTTIAPGVSVSSATFSPYQIYMIHLGDKGKNGKAIGCDDSVVATDGQADATLIRTDDRINQALTYLFSIKTPAYGPSGLDNALSNSELKVDGTTFDLKTGKATVKLSGTLTLGGVCDNPRAQAQIEQTISQFTEIKSIDILLNDKPLQDALGLKGE